MIESECPCCDEEFNEKSKFSDTADVSVNTDNLRRVCFCPVHEENWVYYHLENENEI